MILWQDHGESDGLFERQKMVRFSDIGKLFLYNNIKRAHEAIDARNRCFFGFSFPYLARKRKIFRFFFEKIGPTKESEDQYWSNDLVLSA